MINQACMYAYPRQLASAPPKWSKMQEKLISAWHDPCSNLTCTSPSPLFQNLLQPLPLIIYIRLHRLICIDSEYTPHVSPCIYCGFRMQPIETAFNIHSLERASMMLEIMFECLPCGTIASTRFNSWKIDPRFRAFLELDWHCTEEAEDLWSQCHPSNPLVLWHGISRARTGSRRLQSVGVHQLLPLTPSSRFPHLDLMIDRSRCSQVHVQHPLTQRQRTFNGQCLYGWGTIHTPWEISFTWTSVLFVQFTLLYLLHPVPHLFYSKSLVYETISISYSLSNIHLNIFHRDHKFPMLSYMVSSLFPISLLSLYVFTPYIPNPWTFSSPFLRCVGKLSGYMSPAVRDPILIHSHSHSRHDANLNPGSLVHERRVAHVDDGC